MRERILCQLNVETGYEQISFSMRYLKTLLSVAQSLLHVLFDYCVIAL
jgi:hypothetical protein